MRGKGGQSSTERVEWGRREFEFESELLEEQEELEAINMLILSFHSLETPPTSVYEADLQTVLRVK